MAAAGRPADAFQVRSTLYVAGGPGNKTPPTAVKPVGVVGADAAVTAQTLPDFDDSPPAESRDVTA